MDNDEMKVAGFLMFLLLAGVMPTLLFSISDIYIFIHNNPDLKFSFSFTNSRFTSTLVLMLWTLGMIWPLRLTWTAITVHKKLDVHVHAKLFCTPVVSNFNLPSTYICLYVLYEEGALLNQLEPLYSLGYLQGNT